MQIFFAELPPFHSRTIIFHLIGGMVHAVLLYAGSEAVKAVFSQLFYEEVIHG
jgi:hypothetical protein